MAATDLARPQSAICPADRPQPVAVDLLPVSPGTVQAPPREPRARSRSTSTLLVQQLRELAGQLGLARNKRGSCPRPTVLASGSTTPESSCRDRRRDSPVAPAPVLRPAAHPGREGSPRHRQVLPRQRDITQDILDKIDILFTRLAEIPRGDGTSLPREKHELERIIHPLLQSREGPSIDAGGRDPARALADLKSEVLASRSFTELAAGGALDRFRTLKRRLGDTILHPALLPALLLTTVAIKNRFHELWQDEETSLLEDTNRVRELQRQMEVQPELLTAELREAFEVFTAVQKRFENGRQEESVRREDALELRLTLNRILEQFDRANPSREGFGFATRWALRTSSRPERPRMPASRMTGSGGPRAIRSCRSTSTRSSSPSSWSVATVRPSSSRVPRSLSTLRLEPWEIEACQSLQHRRPSAGTLAAERTRLLILAAAFRVRMDEEAFEIDRLQRRGSEHLVDLLDAAPSPCSGPPSTSAASTGSWTTPCTAATRSGLSSCTVPASASSTRTPSLWLIHNERGGVSPF